jgi:glycosyltransferase involved in cell wall biosynthesis
MALWRKAGATIHVLDMDIRPRRLWTSLRRLLEIARLVSTVRPDLIHSHFVSTTLMLRAALGRNHPIPRIFQVPGPLHLEHTAYRVGEIASAGPRDSWVASSRYILDLYLGAGVARKRLFLSYLSALPPAAPRNPGLRRDLGIADNDLVVGNCCHMYAPKLYLGQRVGLKCHEDIIDALALAIREEPRIRGLLIGGGWNGAKGYEARLRARAAKAAGDRIRMPGFLEESRFAGAWAEFDCVTHVPLSENCGGVVEPLLAGVPVVASRTGGLPEVVMENLTGYLVPARDPAALAKEILRCLESREKSHELARRGNQLVSTMFDNRRTAAEVLRIYEHVLGGGITPPEFDSRAVAENLE